jgi:hypothetical protein
MVPEDVPLPVLRGQLESVASNDGRFLFKGPNLPLRPIWFTKNTNLNRLQ